MKSRKLLRYLVLKIQGGPFGRLEFGHSHRSTQTDLERFFHPNLNSGFGKLYSPEDFSPNPDLKLVVGGLAIFARLSKSLVQLFEKDAPTRSKLYQVVVLYRKVVWLKYLCDFWPLQCQSKRVLIQWLLQIRQGEIFEKLGQIRQNFK